MTMQPGTSRNLPNIALAAATLCLLWGLPARAQTPTIAPAATLKSSPVQPAIDGIFDAFRTHPLVGLGDKHGLAQELDFYAALIRDSRFARDVGNVVVEFGAAAHQGIIDRYVAGEPVPYTELRKVWTDTVGWGAEGANYLGFANFYAQVRATNLALPPDQRIRVWLGEPPIDWSKISTKADVAPFTERRDSHPAELIEKNILAKNRKALVIYGFGHLLNRDPAYLGERRTAPFPGSDAILRKVLTGYANGTPAYHAMTPVEAARTRTALGRGLPVEAIMAGFDTLGALTSIAFRESYSGEEKDFVRDVYDVTFAKGVRRYIIALDANGKMDRLFQRFPIHRPIKLIDLVEQKRPNALFVVVPYTGSMDYMISYPRSANKACDESFEQGVQDWQTPALAPTRGGPLERDLCDLRSGLAADAILYLGPTASLTVSPKNPDLYLDPERGQEISRRSQILYGRPYPAAPVMQNHPVAPVRLQ